MGVHLKSRVIRPRQQDREEDHLDRSPMNRNTIIGIAILCAIVFTFILIYYILRHFRKNYTEPPKYFPAFLKARWKKWDSRSLSATYAPAQREDTETARQPGVDRTQSVRSIMTLPEYRPVPNPERERTIAREGERAGMDVVIEFPETVEEEEQRRETHMQTLYEVRLARAADRQERRARREARRRGERVPSSSSTMTSDNNNNRPGSSPQYAGGGVSSLLNVETGDLGRSTSPSVSPSVQAVVASRSATSLAALIAEPAARLAQVSYAAIGTARPDGSRVRANSAASDREGLLGSAASMGAHSRQGSSSSIGNLSTAPHYAGHARSVSNLSIATYATTSPNLSNASLAARRSSSDSFTLVATHGRASSDLTEMRNPPSYEALAFEQAPPYESPVTTRLEVPLMPPTNLQSTIPPVPSGDITSPSSTAPRGNRLENYSNGGI
ncbi:hypothetical protein BDZ91DRAFT_469638 [Kalaharituber pfeilii]|nr:hypothetical protein BDZ91DRAFT_469638 [Kalaharituber pfeilii]